MDGLLLPLLSAEHFDVLLCAWGAAQERRIGREKGVVDDPAGIASRDLDENVSFLNREVWTYRDIVIDDRWRGAGDEGDAGSAGTKEIELAPNPIARVTGVDVAADDLEFIAVLDRDGFVHADCDGAWVGEFFDAGLPWLFLDQCGDFEPRHTMLHSIRFGEGTLVDDDPQRAVDFARAKHAALAELCRREVADNDISRRFEVAQELKFVADVEEFLERPARLIGMHYDFPAIVHGIGHFGCGRTGAFQVWFAVRNTVEDVSQTKIDDRIVDDHRVLVTVVVAKQGFRVRDPGLFPEENSPNLSLGHGDQRIVDNRAPLGVGSAGLGFSDGAAEGDLWRFHKAKRGSGFNAAVPMGTAKNAHEQLRTLKYAYVSQHKLTTSLKLDFHKFYVVHRGGVPAESVSVLAVEEMEVGSQPWFASRHNQANA